jgi:signal peptidase I
MRTKLLLPALLLALAPLLVVRPVLVSGPSMEPAFRDGDLRWGLRAWVAGPPRRGEVWVVQGPQGPGLKRVLGLPGEGVELKGPRLLVDGRPLEEPWVASPELSDQGPWACGEGYLVLGDHRTVSVDGRAWGPLPRSAFVARLLAR